MELINIEKEEEKINMMAPLTWAYIGDAVFELYIRTYLINKTNLRQYPHGYCRFHLTQLRTKSQKKSSPLN